MKRGIYEAYIKNNLKLKKIINMLKKVAIIMEPEVFKLEFDKDDRVMVIENIKVEKIINYNKKRKYENR